MKMIVRWLLLAGALLLVADLYPGVSVDGFGSALFAAFLVGLFNTLVRPLLVLLTLPVTLLTLGLFLFFIEQPSAVGGSVQTTPATCGQSNGSASVSGTGGTPGYGYVWSTGAVGANLNNVAAD